MNTPMITQNIAQTVSASEFRRRIHKLRRQRELRRRYVLLFLSVMIVFLMTVSFHSFISVAHEDEKMTYKYYSSIMIESGQTLWSIADSHMSADYSNHNDYIEEVTRINHLSTEDIIAGQYLIIPYYSEEYIN